MDFKMTRELNEIFGTCSEKSLSPKDTALVTFAAKLAAGHDSKTLELGKIAKTKGVSVEELNRVACLCACTAGPKVTRTYAEALKGARIKGSATLIKGESFQKCSEKSLETKTHHLVSLAACLATRCQCASGHIIEARNAGATAEELARCACIAACISGMRVKYDFLAKLESTRNCKACAC